MGDKAPHSGGMPAAISYADPFCRSIALPSLTFTQLAELQSGTLDPVGGDEDNTLELWPNPSQFVGFLKSVNRDEVSSEIYLKVLEAHTKLQEFDNPLKYGENMCLA